mgnify:CR=1 FL=1
MRLLKTYNIFWISVLLILIFLSVFHAYIGADAPYYLAISRDISNGLVPFEDINSMYAPAMMYLNSIIFKIFDDPGYHYFLVFKYVLILL